MVKSLRAFSSLAISIAIAGFIWANRGNLQDFVSYTVAYGFSVMNASAFGTEIEIPPANSKAERIAQVICKQSLKPNADTSELENSTDKMINNLQNADDFSDVQEEIKKFVSEDESIL